MNWSLLKSGSLGAASLLAAALFAGPALADGLPGRGRIAAPEPRCTVAANVGLTTDYVFRGISQTFEDPALQGGVDLTCGKFYLGVWGSNVDFGAVGPATTIANLEVDIYGGYKTKLGIFDVDVGFIYYAYPGSFGPANLDYVEIKLGASASLWKDGTVSGTLFYSPEYTGNTGETLTYELGLTQALPKVGIFSPTFSALYGHVDFQDFGFLSYSYWNAGVTLGFLDKWSLDLRYWDTDNDGAAFLAGPLADERFVATIKYTF